MIIAPACIHGGRALAAAEFQSDAFRKSIGFRQANQVCLSRLFAHQNADMDAGISFIRSGTRAESTHTVKSATQ
jgi:hypothetical protein